MEVLSAEVAFVDGDTTVALDDIAAVNGAASVADGTMPESLLVSSAADCRTASFVESERKVKADAIVAIARLAPESGLRSLPAGDSCRESSAVLAVALWLDRRKLPNHERWLTLRIMRRDAPRGEGLAGRDRRVSAAAPLSSPGFVDSVADDLGFREGDASLFCEGDRGYRRCLSLEEGVDGAETVDVAGLGSSAVCVAAAVGKAVETVVGAKVRVGEEGAGFGAVVGLCTGASGRALGGISTESKTADAAALLPSVEMECSE